MCLRMRAHFVNDVIPDVAWRKAAKFLQNIHANAVYVLAFVRVSVCVCIGDYATRRAETITFATKAKLHCNYVFCMIIV